MKEPLAELYYGRSESDVFSRWYAKVDDLQPKLVELVSEITEKPAFGTSKVDHALQELTEKKMRFEEFKIRLTGDGDLPLKD